MQTKGKKILKGVTALMLCAVLLVTSLPMTFAAWEHTYNPTPTFSSDPAERRYSAYKTASGGISIVYPNATADKTLDDTKRVVGYMIELVDMGVTRELHTDTVILRKTIDAQGLSTYEESISAAELRSIPGLESGLLADHSYNISITAYDNEGWFSETLNTAVSSVPMYVPRGVEPLTTDEHAARMMMDMNAAGEDTGVLLTGSASTDLSIIGAADQTGMEDTSGKDTTAYGFTIRNISDTEKGYMTAYSREAWDYSGAEEIWYWVDLSQVELHNLAFQMAANEKYLYRADSTGTHEQNREADYLTEDSCVFSTAGYTGDDAYCWLQQEDGSWLKQSMPSGKMDLGHFRGYVRIPIEFFCLTKDSVVEADNDNWNTNYESAMGTNTRRDHNSHDYTEEEVKGKMDEVYNTYFKLAEPVTVDKAGTPITDALLLQHFALYGRWKIANGLTQWSTPKQQGWGKEYGAMLAADITSSNVINHNDKRAYIEDGEVVNRENGYKAIEDIKAAGFTYSGASADSLNKSFFIDNVLFYRTDHQPYPEQSLNGSPNTGDAVANYYDQTKEIPRAIFNACDQYLSDDPDWGDFRAVTYIEDMIKAYTEAFKGSEAGNDFLSEDNLQQTAEEINMEDSWQNFLDARKACQDAGTYGKDNNEPTDLVGSLASEIEKLPDVESALTISVEAQEVITRVWQVYQQLSLDQLDMLGRVNEQKILDYYQYMESLLRENSVPVGDSLASTPYIMFNDFEWAPIGTRAWQLENDTNAGNPGGKRISTGTFDNYHRTDVDDLSTADYRFKKNIVTYTGSTFEVFGGHENDNIETERLTGATDTLVNNLKDNGTLYWNPAWATIDENGFLGTHGLTTTIDSQYYINNEGNYNAVSFTRDGAENDDPAQLRTQNTGLDNLGDFANSSITIASGANPPICLVFYADFSEISNFRLSVAFHCYCPNHDNYGDPEFEDFSLDFGNDAANRRFWLLSPNTGEWVQCNVNNRKYVLPSNSSGNDGVTDLSLDHYRGYIMIPLEYFRSGTRGGFNLGGYDYTLNTDAAALNSIYRIQIGVAPLDSVNSDGNAAAAELDGRSFTIDNVGFSYDETAYADQYASRQDQFFDEMVDAKSLSAAKFEEMVQSIDPYDDETLEAKVLEAEEYYAKLTNYQKKHKSVVKAYKALAQYSEFFRDPGSRPAATMTVDEIKAAIAALPDEMTGRDGRDPVRDEYDLPYPYNIDTDSIDYDKYGLTTTGTSQTDKQAEVNEKIQAVFDLYEKQVACLTTAQEAEIGEEILQQATHAYEAATRLRNLEAAYTNARKIWQDFAILYYDPGDHAPGELGSEMLNNAFFSIADLQSSGGEMDLNAMWRNYKDLSLYGKYVLENMGTVMAGATESENVVTTLQRLRHNIYTIPLGKLGPDNTWISEGESLTGGVLQLRDKYQDYYDKALDAIQNKKLFNTSTIELTELYKQHDIYHSLVPAYYCILDLYYLWHYTDDTQTRNLMSHQWEDIGTDGYPDGINALFPAEQVALNSRTDEETTITLRPDTLSGSAQYNVQYSVFLPETMDDDLSYLTVTSENGKLMQDGTSYQADYTVEINRPSSASTIPSTTNANTPASVSYAASALQTETEIGKVANNVATTRSPRNYTFNVRLASDPAAPVMLEDTLTVQFYRGDGTVIESATKKINILYVPGEGYSVTIPAEVPIKWGETEPQDVSYTVLTTLSAGYIEVSVADNDEHPGVLISNTGEEISFTTSDKFSDKQKFDGLMTKKTSPDPKPTLTVSDWSGKVPNKYTTQLTYTVTYTDDSAG